MCIVIGLSGVFLVGMITGCSPAENEVPKKESDAVVSRKVTKRVCSLVEIGNFGENDDLDTENSNSIDTSQILDKLKDLSAPEDNSEEIAAEIKELKKDEELKKDDVTEDISELGGHDELKSKDKETPDIPEMAVPTDIKKEVEKTPDSSADGTTELSSLPVPLSTPEKSHVQNTVGADASKKTVPEDTSEADALVEGVIDRVYDTQGSQPFLTDEDIETALKIKKEAAAEATSKESLPVLDNPSSENREDLENAASVSTSEFNNTEKKHDVMKKNTHSLGRNSSSEENDTVNSEELIKEHAAAFIGLAKNIPAEVAKELKDANFQNYSLYVGRGSAGIIYAVRYMEYVGEDFSLDYFTLTRSPAYKKWLEEQKKYTRPTSSSGEFWLNMAELYHAP